MYDCVILSLSKCWALPPREMLKQFCFAKLFHRAVALYASIFLKQKGFPLQSLTQTIKMEFSFGKPTDAKVSELLKQSTGFKKTDIEKSILLIKEAIELDSSLSHYIKLVNYLSIANKKDEAISTYNFLIEKYKSNNDFFNCRNRYQLYENYSKFLFKTQKYDEHIFYSCLSLFNELINRSEERRVGKECRL